MDSCQRFVRMLARLDPSFEDLLQEHMEDNGELLPHVFLGDFGRLLLTLADASRDLTPKLEAVAAILEEGMSGDESVQEMIAVSFLESLDATSPGFPRLQRILGKRTRAQLDVYLMQ